MLIFLFGFFVCVCLAAVVVVGCFRTGRVQFDDDEYLGVPSDPFVVVVQTHNDVTEEFQGYDLSFERDQLIIYGQNGSPSVGFTPGFVRSFRVK